MGSRFVVISRTISVLERLAEATSPLSLTEVALRTELHKSTIYRILTALASLGYLEQDAETGLYTIGPRVLFLSEGYNRQLKIQTKARPALQSLVEEFNETVALSVRSDIHRVCIFQIEGTMEVRRILKVGVPFPLHCGSSSKVLLAFLPEEERDEILARLNYERFTPSSPRNAETLRTQLEEIRRLGVAAVQGERVDGGSGVSAPIFDSAGKVVAAISIYPPSIRFTPEKVARFSKAVKKAADQVSSTLGYSPDRNVEVAPSRSLGQLG